MFNLDISAGASEQEKELRLAKISLFHYWLFYYMYSADHKFLETVINEKFAFSKHLFGRDLNMITKYSKADSRGHPRNDKTGLPLIPRKCYTVPVIYRKGKLAVNWKLIDRVVDSVRHRLYEINVLTSERNIVIRKYDLEEILRSERREGKWEHPDCLKCPVQPCRHDFEQLRRYQRAFMTKYLWDQNFQGNRYVILYKESSKDFDG